MSNSTNVSKLDFEGLNRELLTRVNELLVRWLPSGRVVGSEYVCGNLNGEVGSSLSVNRFTGEWADFATADKGGDLISLFAAIGGLKQGDAARCLAKEISFNLSNNEQHSAPVVTSEPIRPPVDAPPTMIHPKHGKPSMSWVYRYADGSPWWYLGRYETKEGKQFCPWLWCGERWIMKAIPPLRGLYGIELLESRSDAPVMICEGERSCDSARELLGHIYVVVTWPGGVNALDKIDWTPLYKRSIIIWPDADKPGIQAAEKIASILAPHCSPINILNTLGAMI